MRAQPTEQRRLLALLVGDIVGYSRLMATDEADTFYRLKDLQASLIMPAAARNRGRIVKWTGDGFIASFESAVDAMRAAVEIQSGATAAGAASLEERRIAFRMGVNVGDVIVTQGDLYGDAVNVAARLQTLAPPGGICVSRAVRDTVKGKFGIEFEDRGEFEVKNIPDPVGIYAAVFQTVAWAMEREAAPQPSPWRARLVAAALGAAVLAGLWLGTGWDPAALVAGLRSSPSPPPATPPKDAPPAPDAPLTAARLAGMPGLSPSARESLVRRYLDAPGAKALAIAPERQASWLTFANASAEVAEQRALESCQFVYGAPCLLFARDAEVFAPKASGEWVRRDMPRLSYAGAFAIDQIPSLSQTARTGQAVRGYGPAAGPKAMAFHPRGRVFTVTAAASQNAAEEGALAACNGDPERRDQDGPCVLYAVGDQVVLPQRAQAPMTIAGATLSPGDGVRAALAAARPDATPRNLDDWANAYEAAAGSKALAAALDPGGVVRLASGRPSAAAAEEAALENCQVLQGRPCVLLAANADLRAQPGARWLPRDMPRARYEGRFDPEQIPGANSGVRTQPDLRAYRTAPGAKAVAWIPAGGRAFAVTGAPDQRAADERALAACTAALDRNGEHCYLYATGDQVVLPRRLTVPFDDPYSRIAIAAALAGPLAHLPSYATVRGAKALAVNPEAGRPYQRSGMESRDRARQLALEGCQQAYGSACVLVAVDADLVAPDPRAAPRVDMPRLHYQGAYDPDQVPFVRLTPELRQYASMQAPKAIAIRPDRARAIVVEGAGSQAEAERRALELCNDGGSRFPCFLYASGDRVVLPERRTQASP